MPMTLRTHQLWLRIAIFIAVSIASIALLRRWANPGYMPQTFDRSSWATGTVETRGHMARDLLQSHKIVGMTQEEVVELIGQPDEDQQSLNRFRYYLGHMGRNPDFPFLTKFSLLISFDPDGKAGSALIAD